MDHSIQTMLGSHPQHPATDEVKACIAVCFQCAETCKSCADSCLSEDMVQGMIRCIRLNLDCADVCNATGNLLLRQTESDESVVAAQLQACVTASRLCGQECSMHAEAMEHCRICAESCQECTEHCEAVLRHLHS